MYVRCLFLSNGRYYTKNTPLALEDNGGVADGFGGFGAHFFAEHLVAVGVGEQETLCFAEGFCGGDRGGGGARAAGVEVGTGGFEHFFRLHLDSVIDKLPVVDLHSPPQCLFTRPHRRKAVPRAVMRQVGRADADDFAFVVAGDNAADYFARLYRLHTGRRKNGQDSRTREKVLNKRHLNFHTVLSGVGGRIAYRRAAFDNGGGKLGVDGHVAQRCCPGAPVIKHRHRAIVAVGGAEDYKGIHLLVPLFDGGKHHRRDSAAEGPAGVRDDAGCYRLGQLLSYRRRVETFFYFIDTGILPAGVELPGHYRFSRFHLRHLLLAFAAHSRYYWRLVPNANIVTLKVIKTMASEKKSSVAVVMGSGSDMEVMEKCIDTLKEFGIEPIVRIISAHRTPDVAAEFADNAVKNGLKVIIAAAGMAAHLAGAIAGRTTLPVIGVPLAAKGALGGLDALLSTVQMPAGVPVATVAVGKAGAKNAAVLAAQILALSEDELPEKLEQFRKRQRRKVIEADSAVG